MSESGKVRPEHLRRQAYLYVRQSSIRQVQENRESTARQYQLQRRAQVLGWPSGGIVVIDEDLGLSAATATDRDGFQRLVADVGLGRVGLVMGLEVSRLARSSSDWHRLLEICALADTLILDEDGLYDPAHFNDRLLLGLKGAMSEAELHVLRARLIGGQLNKARRGELWIRPPIGYVHDGKQGLVFDPDRQIQAAVRMLFDEFRSGGSAEHVVRHFRRKGLLWPRRLAGGVRAGEVIWVELVHSRVLNILHNPRYAGAYVYGRSRQRKRGGHVLFRRLPREQWKVFLPNAHPPYVSWEEFESNQARLLDNSNGYGPDRRKSPPREGTALLQGMVICGICGLRMTVRYEKSGRHPSPVYYCQRRGIETAQPACQRVPGGALDQAVARDLLDAVTPATLEVALEVFEQLRQRRDEVDRLRRAQIERAREEAEAAGRHYLLVRPENRLVADALEGQWNQKLAELSRLEEEYARTEERKNGPLSEADREQIMGLARDLPRVWNDPRTSARDRKRMLRLLVEDVTLRRDAEKIQAAIRWKGGAKTVLEHPVPTSIADRVRTPPEIVERVRALATERTDREIAQSLNARGLRSGRGHRFNPRIVKVIRYTHGIESLQDHLLKQGWLTLRQVAAQLNAHYQTVKNFAIEGVLEARRVNDKDEILIAPLTGALPKPWPGKRFKDRRRFPQCSSKRQNGVQYAD